MLQTNKPYQRIQVMSLTPVEHEAYNSNPEIQTTVNSVGNMIMDLTSDDDIDMYMLFSLNNEDDESEYSLSFSGSTLSLEFSPDMIQVVDFNEGDEEVLMGFARNEVNAATTYLVNLATPNE